MRAAALERKINQELLALSADQTVSPLWLGVERQLSPSSQKIVDNRLEWSLG